MTKNERRGRHGRAPKADTPVVSPVFTAMDTPIHLMNLGLLSLHALHSGEALVSNEVSDILEVHPASPDPTGGMAVMAVDAMLFGVDQLSRGNQFVGAMLDSAIRWWRDLEAGLAEVILPPTSRDLHIMPDSAGRVLSPPIDLTPKGIVLAMTGFANAMSQAWSNALEHELQIEASEEAKQDEGGGADVGVFLTS